MAEGKLGFSIQTDRFQEDSEEDQTQNTVLTSEALLTTRPKRLISFLPKEVQFPDLSLDRYSNVIDFFF
jgi:hypothetical protein